MSEKITAQQLAELKAALANATKGEWEYRSHEFDDWGVIRSDKGAEATGFIVAISRAGGDADLDAHRAAKTDPYEPNGRFIVLAHNLLPALIAAAEEVGQLRAELAANNDLTTVYMLAFSKGEESGKRAGREEAAKAAEGRPMDGNQRCGENNISWDERGHYGEGRSDAAAAIRALNGEKTDG
jgi:hypothetical protein